MRKTDMGKIERTRRCDGKEDALRERGLVFVYPSFHLALVKEWQCLCCPRSLLCDCIRGHGRDAARTRKGSVAFSGSPGAARLIVEVALKYDSTLERNRREDEWRCRCMSSEATSQTIIAKPKFSRRKLANHVHWLFEEFLRRGNIDRSSKH